ncbi:auxin efflux carrier superfamily [Fistulina hepatica ATCC 64428]|uniref:Auxin efflux carrier superfamily n=1 Tax=Fistulina hepatica ATCC 64428 TaxID=1128425 RepID=A0A0D7A9C6_9AGAR|nr:auxin efflux carrier superfamily [Fistulina hepatica ATCC 64428]
MATSGIVTSFLGALQAALSVLLTMAYGAIAARLQIVSNSTAKEVSHLCVSIFMPALLFYNVGSQLHLDTLMRYMPIIIWSISYNFITIALGSLASQRLNAPRWTIVAATFNNSTSLPLLLLTSFEVSGVLKPLLVPGDDDTAAIRRASVYFLINATVSNTLTFSLGPRLLRPLPGRGEPEAWQQRPHAMQRTLSSADDEDDIHRYDEESTLVYEEEHETVQKKPPSRSELLWHHVIDFLSQFINAPVAGASLGAVVGLVPWLHEQFFEKGGIFIAWLTSSIKNIGALFASLQVVVVGVKLYNSLESLRRGNDVGSIAWRPTVGTLLVRFAIWHVASISLVYLLAAKTRLLPNDPILWFSMMLMPVGPSAMKLSALSDVSDISEKEKMKIARFLALSYMVTPLICFAAVGSLTMSEHLMNSSHL